MSSDSDSDDDVQMKQFLEAADPTLLNNSMFQCNDATKEAENRSNAVKTVAKETDIPKTQRYLVEENETGTDFNLPETMQNHLAKKLSQILKQHYEFCDIETKEKSPSIKNKYKNRVKLLKGDECCVKPYEEFEYETKGPEKKPTIKRRLVDNKTDDTEVNLKSIAVNGEYILSGAEVKAWAKKKERNDKVFHYRLASTGVSHAVEDINEFTELRRKNKWTENKIKNFKKM